MDLNAVRTKLLGFGMQLLDGIDPNPDNFVCAGIIHTRTQAVGCLLRLEPNKQAQVSSLSLQFAWYLLNPAYQNAIAPKHFIGTSKFFNKMSVQCMFYNKRYFSEYLFLQKYSNKLTVAV
jgi:hypothetical protein